MYVPDVKTDINDTLDFISEMQCYLTSGESYYYLSVMEYYDWRGYLSEDQVRMLEQIAAAIIERTRSAENFF